MTPEKRIFSTAFLSLGSIQFFTITIIFALLLIANAHGFYHPLAWVVGIGATIYLGFYIAKRRPIFIDEARSFHKESFVVHIGNPILTACIVGLFPKMKHSIITLTGTYSIKNDKKLVYFQQIDQPRMMQTIGDLVFMLLAISFIALVLVIIIREDSPNLSNAVVITFLASGRYLPGFLQQWCYRNITEAPKNSIYVTPLWDGFFGIVSYDNAHIILNQKVMQFDPIVYNYIVSHEKGHIHHRDVLKIIAINSMILAGFIGYSILLVPYGSAASYLLGLSFLGILLSYQSVPSMEFKADKFAAEQLGYAECLQALKMLRRSELGDRMIVKRLSPAARIMQLIFGGTVPIDERIRFLENEPNK